MIGNRFRIDSLLKRSQWQNRITPAKIFRSSFGKMGKKFRRERGGRSVLGRRKASVVNLVMLRQSYPTETVLSNKITRNILVLSFKNSPRKVLGRRTAIGSGTKHVPHAGAAIKTKNLRILRKGKSERERERELVLFCGLRDGRHSGDGKRIPRRNNPAHLYCAMCLTLAIRNETRVNVTLTLMSKAVRKPQVRQYLGFCSAYS